MIGGSHGVKHACRKDTGKQCGTDGCGGNCGKCGINQKCDDKFQCVCEFAACTGKCCASNEKCENNLCVPICTPNCTGKECGPDGCGGTCGKCHASSICTDQQKCVGLCEYNCLNKQCGSDGCGGSCGTCEVGWLCNDKGACVHDCTPSCVGKQCGGNGCGGSCGTCPNGFYCNATGQCTAQCTPDCFLKECGSDGCGGTCGSCEPGVYCTAAGWCGSKCLACNHEPECSDINFAAGHLSDFNISAAVIVKKLGNTPAPTGGHMLKLTTGEGITTEKSSVIFQTCLKPGGYGVVVDWKFYSEEFKEYCNSNFQDALQISLEVGGQVTVVDKATIRDLCEKTTDCPTCGSHFIGLEPSDVSFDQGGVWNTPWTVSIKGFEVPPGGGQVNLTIGLTDAGDTIFDSVLLVDRVRFLPCNQFCGVFDCGANPPCQCDSCPPQGICSLGKCCVPSCTGKTCGDNGCGGSCGTCTGAGSMCYQGNCCVPNCTGKQCGSDGCGGSCGTCVGPQDLCVNNQCVCQPACQGKQCGPDGCGGQCGSCDDGMACSLDFCTAQGLCQHDETACCKNNGDCNDGNDCTTDTCLLGACHNDPNNDPNCCDPKPFDEQFPGGQPAGWLLDPLATGVGWQVAAGPGTPGQFTLRYANLATNNYDNGAANKGNALSPTIKLKAGVDYALSFDVYMDVESNVSYDRLTVALSKDGINWYPVWTKADYLVMKSWQKVTLNISSLAGGAVRIRFSFDTVDGFSNSTTGAYLDNVKVTTGCQQPTCTADSGCIDDLIGGNGKCVNGKCLFQLPLSCTYNWQCDDANACTAQSCFLQSVCLFTQYPDCCLDGAECDDANACTTDACVDGAIHPICTNTAIANCCLEAADCDDGDPCTEDLCAAPGGQCQNPKIPECCVLDIDCVDFNPCTVDTCFDNKCLHVDSCCKGDLECNDGNSCTTDKCIDGDCIFTFVPGPGCCVQPAFRDDFSGGNAKGWTLGTTWQIGAAKASPALSSFNPDPASDHSTGSDNMLAGVLIGGNTTAGQAHDYYYLTSPVIDISAAVQPYLVFWRFLNSDYPPYMTNRIQVYNGSQWVSIWTQTDGEFITDSAWNLRSFNVTAHKNANFRFRIGFMTNNQVYATPSWSLDDVSVVDYAPLAEYPLCCGKLSDCQGIVPGVTSCTSGYCK